MASLSCAAPDVALPTPYAQHAQSNPIESHSREYWLAFAAPLLMPPLRALSLMHPPLPLCPQAETAAAAAHAGAASAQAAREAAAEATQAAAVARGQREVRAVTYRYGRWHAPTAPRKFPLPSRATATVTHRYRLSLPRRRLRPKLPNVRVRRWRRRRRKRRRRPKVPSHTVPSGDDIPPRSLNSRIHRLDRLIFHSRIHRRVIHLPTQISTSFLTHLRRSGDAGGVGCVTLPFHFHVHHH